MSTAEKVLAALGPYKLKQEANGEYRCNNPYHTGSDSMAFTLTIDPDGEHGAFRNFAAKPGEPEQGSLYELAEFLGVEWPRQQHQPQERPQQQPPPEKEKRHAAANTKRGYEGLDDYADAHGIPGDVLRQCGWAVSTKDDRPALMFKTAGGWRYRFIDGQKPVFKSDQGHTRCWYGLNSAFYKRIEAGQPLVICNGEISTIAGRYHGLAALCVTSGENVIPPDLMDELIQELGAHQPEVLVALDCDPVGQKYGLQIAAQFRERGYKARAVDLGFTTGGDLADFCALYKEGTPTILELLPSLRPAIINEANGKWTIYHISELDKLPDVSWILENEIPTGLTAIYGSSGAGKSVYAAGLTLEIALQHGPVLYIAGEGISGYKKRVHAWLLHHDKTTKQASDFYLGAGTPNLMESYDVSLLANQIASMDLSAVFVDTLAMAMSGGDENSARDMGVVIDSCRELLDVAEAVIIVHHTGKDGSAERGSSAFRGACDFMIRVNRYDDDRVQIENAKSKDSEPFDNKMLGFVKVATQYGESVILIPDELIERSADDPLGQMQQQVLEVFGMEIHQDSTVSFSEVADYCNMPRGKAGRVINGLAKRGLLEKTGTGYGSFRISEAGLARLNGSTDSFDRFDRFDRTGEDLIASKNARSNRSSDQTGEKGDQTDLEADQSAHKADQLALLNVESEKKHHTEWEK